LGQAGWITQGDQSLWRLTLKCASVGRRALPEQTTRDVLHPLAIDLRDLTGETVRYFLVRNESFTLMGGVESNHAVRAVEHELSGGIPVQATAIGKAALAAAPAHVVEEFLSRPLAGVTRHTLVDPRQIRREIELTRQRGWAQVVEELYLDVGGVAAVMPIFDGLAVGIGISYPLHRAGKRVVLGYGREVHRAVTRAAELLTGMDAETGAMGA
jgi:DNA-binding IclR family transcriptional regulator